MRKVAYHNPTDRIQHIGPVMVRPHTTREVDERDHPGFKSRKTEVAPPEDPVVKIQKESVAAIKEAFPGLANEELDQLEALENDKEKPRKGVLEAIAEERLNRSQAGGEGDGENAGDEGQSGEGGEGGEGEGE